MLLLSLFLFPPPPLRRSRLADFWIAHWLLMSTVSLSLGCQPRYRERELCLSVPKTNHKQHRIKIRACCITKEHSHFPSLFPCIEPNCCVVVMRRELRCLRLTLWCRSFPPYSNLPLIHAAQLLLRIGQIKPQHTVGMKQQHTRSLFIPKAKVSKLRNGRADNNITPSPAVFAACICLLYLSYAAVTLVVLAVTYETWVDVFSLNELVSYPQSP